MAFNLHLNYLHLKLNDFVEKVKKNTNKKLQVKFKHFFNICSDFFYM